MPDGRSPHTRFLDDVRDLSRMASITYPLVEHMLYFKTKERTPNGDVIFVARDEQVENVRFAVQDLLDRAQSLAERCEQMSEQLEA